MTSHFFFLLGFCFLLGMCPVKCVNRLVRFRPPLPPLAGHQLRLLGHRFLLPL